MTSLGPATGQHGDEDDPEPHGRRQAALVSTRTLVIGGVATAVASLAGISAGIATAAEIAPTYGLGVRLVAGLLAGATTGFLVLLTALSKLHQLVG